MAHVRKTRQQKIQISQRRAEQITSQATDEVVGDTVSLQNSTMLAQELAKPSLAIDTHIQATYTYAQQELHRIAWISLVCLGLLLIATVFLSEIPMVTDLRQWLGLPHFSPLSN